MARIREVFWAPDLGFLDEPVMLLGPFILSWRRILGLFSLVLIALVLRTPAKMPIPGSPIGLDQILIIGAAAGLSALMLAPRKAVPIEQQLLGLLFPTTKKQQRQRSREEVLVIKTDTIPHTLEITGYAVDPRTGQPLDTPVQIIVDNHLVAEIRPDPTGKYTAKIELEPGLHHITVMLKEPQVKIKETKIRIVL